MATKDWTLEEKFELYRLVKNEGPSWTEYSELFGVTPNAVRQKFRYTDWINLFAELGIEEQDVLDDNVEIYDLLEDNENEPGDEWEDDDEEYDEDEIEEEQDEDLTEEDIADQMVESEKKNILEKSERRVVKELVRKAAETDLIYEKITAAIAKVEPFNPKNIKYPANFRATTSPQEAALCLSDLHCGLAVLEEEVGGIVGDYNIKTFKRRLWSLVEKTIRITNHHRKSYRIDRLHIFALGDFVHGMITAGKWGFLHTEQNIMDQVLTLVSEVKKAIVELMRILKILNHQKTTG